MYFGEHMCAFLSHIDLGVELPDDMLWEYSGLLHTAQHFFK